MTSPKSTCTPPTCAGRSSRSASPRPPEAWRWGGPDWDQRSAPLRRRRGDDRGRRPGASRSAGNGCWVRRRAAQVSGSSRDEAERGPGRDHARRGPDGLETQSRSAGYGSVRIRLRRGDERGRAVEVQDGVAVLTLNRPDRLNAWTPEMQTRYFDLLEECARARGRPRDRPHRRRPRFLRRRRHAEPAALAGGDGEREHRRHDPRPVTFALAIPKPVIAAINGAVRRARACPRA